MNPELRTFRNKRVTVVGLGRSGLSTAILLKRLGSEVTVTEAARTPPVQRFARELGRRNVPVETGIHTREFIERRDLIVASPGVADSAAPLKWARELKIPVIDEMELAYRLTPAPIVAITGTNGKSTVTHLAGRILRMEGRKVSVCGNIGLPATSEVFSWDPEYTVVEEISSFQLSRTQQFCPWISVILNLSRNHLDRHEDFAAYQKAKMKIFANQTENDWCLLNYDDPQLRRLKGKIRARVLFFSIRRKVEGLYARDGQIMENREGKEREIGRVERIRLQEPHNLANALAASLIGIVCAVPPPAIMEVLEEFSGLEHRLEEVATVDGVRFINDSKATTVAATIAALEAASEPVVLICGGRDKGSDFGQLRKAAAEKVRALVLIGEAKEKISRALEEVFSSGCVFSADSLARAVEIAAGIARPGWTVLLSPMCASFDMFRNFEERGKVFKQAVKELVRSKCGMRIAECGVRNEKETNEEYP